MSDWQAFVDECKARVLLIESSRDEGTFARRYAEDIPRLLARIDELDEQLGIADKEIRELE